MHFHWFHVPIFSYSCNQLTLLILIHDFVVLSRFILRLLNGGFGILKCACLVIRIKRFLAVFVHSPEMLAYHESLFVQTMMLGT